MREVPRFSTVLSKNAGSMFLFYGGIRLPNFPVWHCVESKYPEEFAFAAILFTSYKDAETTRNSLPEPSRIRIVQIPNPWETELPL